MSADREILYEGHHLVLLRKQGWEYVEHRTAKEAVMVVAFTADERLVLVEEFRPAVGAPVISLPAGLVGDAGPEETADAARRELREETGFESSSWEYLARGPGSAGATSEIVHFYLARGADLVGEQAAEDQGQIRVYVIALDQLASWSGEQERRGLFLDPKIWAGLHMAQRAQASPLGS